MEMENETTKGLRSVVAGGSPELPVGKFRCLFDSTCGGLDFRQVAGARDGIAVTINMATLCHDYASIQRWTSRPR